jgi:hypothetical protein
MKLLIMQLSLASCHFLHIDILLNILFSNALSLFLSWLFNDAVIEAT